MKVLLFPLIVIAAVYFSRRVSLYLTVALTSGWVVSALLKKSNLITITQELLFLWIVYLFLHLYFKKMEEERRRFEESFAPLEKKYRSLKEENERVNSTLAVSKKEVAKLLSSYEIAREITASLHLEKVFSLIKNIFSKSFNFSQFILFLKKEGVVKPVVTVGTEKFLNQSILQREGGEVINWLFSFNQPFYSPDISREKEIRKKLNFPHLHSCVLFPLVIKEEKIGLILGFSEKIDAFSSEERERIGIITTQVAIGIEKALLYEEIERLAIIDGLTQIYTHRHFIELLLQEIEKCKRYHFSFALLMIDIDDFKKCNDTYGHLAGDEVLKQLAKLVKDSLLEVDVTGRYGGEEFAVFLPQQGNLNLVARKAEEIRRKIEGYKFVLPNRKKIQITVSIGISFYPGDGTNLHDLIDKADQALYHAKNKGKNKVVSYKEISAESLQK